MVPVYIFLSVILIAVCAIVFWCDVLDQKLTEIKSDLEEIKKIK